MKIDKKSAIIIGLVIALVLSLSFTGISHYQREQDQKVQDARVEGVQDGMLSVWNNIISQLNTNGYVVLNVETTNGTQTIYLQPIEG